MTKNRQNDTSIRIFIQAVKARFGIELVQEYRFHPKRLWRADMCCLEHRIIIEVEGGVYTNGRHTRSSGFLKDVEKYNTATCLGYRIIRVTPDTLLSNQTFEYIEQLLKLETK